jgi:alkylhydroperoxidase family enzyme
LAVLQGDDESLAPRARTLARLAVTLTARPWAVTQVAVEDARRQGLDEEQIEAAIGVISLFNYFTRVADATGIEFDYPTALPAFEPDLGQVTAPRPDRPVSLSRPAGSRRRPQLEGLRAAWESWRAYVLEADQPISQRERRLLAAVAAQEAADWEGAEALNAFKSGPDGDDQLIGFARKLSRQPWRMEEGDLDRLRSLGYSEEAVLHVISVVAHQNADSRLALGLGKSRSLCRTGRGSRPRHPLTRTPGKTLWGRTGIRFPSPIPVRPGAAVPNRLPPV